MSALCRLTGTRNLLKIFDNTNPSHLVRAIQIKAIPPKDQAISLLEHDTNNMKLGRPMSPHLTIYKFPLPAMSSISHRITGMGLSAYVYMLAAGPLFWKDYNSFIVALSGMGPAAHLSIKFMIALPFAYHLANGLRHLIWDTGKFLTIKEVYSTGNVVFAMTALFTALLMAM